MDHIAGSDFGGEVGKAGQDAGMFICMPAQVKHANMHACKLACMHVRILKSIHAYCGVPFRGDGAG